MIGIVCETCETNRHRVTLAPIYEEAC
jgi:hypothetical protein